MKQIMKTKTTKHSIRVKMITSLIVLLVVSILILWFLNVKFLPNYYVEYKVKTIEETRRESERIYDDFLSSGNISRFTRDMSKLEGNNNVSINIFRMQINQMLLFSEYPIYMTPGESTTMLERIVNNFDFTDSDNKNVEYLEIEDDYRVIKVYDETSDTYYMDLFGAINDRTYQIYIRSNLDGIYEAVNVSNRFLLYVGLIVVILGSLVMLVISNNYTKPIYDLSHIAYAMSNLDFSIKYQDKRKDELGVLGNSINNLSEQLEHTILELKTANNELQKDIEKKVEIEEMRTEFLSNVTHELKTPIALIQGYAEGLKDNISEDPQSREFYCEVIMDEAMKMNNMVKKLLSLNQIESGKNAVEFSHFNIVPVISSVVQSFDIVAQQKGVRFVFDTSKEYYVWADEYMMEEVITNYISNAMNHIKEPNVIEIKIGFIEEGVLRISVFNTGDPIPEEDIPNIWTKFYKVDKARTREYGGNGIGLSIVKAIMDAHNQRYGVCNKANGVEFWFDCDGRVK